MKRINNHAVAVEAVNTRHGTVVGPFMTDLTGYRNSPLPGRLVQQRPFPRPFGGAPQHRHRPCPTARRPVAQEVQKFLEVDVLVDLDSDDVYLGELNPRISGASSITNVTAGAYADIPLFLFHLLEFADVDYTVDVGDINERWRELAAVDVWAQLIEGAERRRRGASSPHRHRAVPVNRGRHMAFVGVTNDWHDVTHEDECFTCGSTAPATTASGRRPGMFW